MFVYRLRCWPNIKPALAKRVVFAGKDCQVQNGSAGVKQYSLG